MFDGSDYHAWHGLAPMAHFHRDSHPDLFLAEGKGSHVTDRAGRRYLDARSSMWNVTLGYSCEPVKAAIRRQLDELPFATIMRFEQPPAIMAQYAAALASMLPDSLGHIRFGNTGSQMTEAAAMLSRFYRRLTGEPGRTLVVTLESSYHGTGPLATALTGEPKLQEFSAPLDPDVRHVTAPPVAGDCDGSAARAVLDLINELGADRVTAVMLEPVMGTDTITLPRDYLDRLIRECRALGVHVILDEVTTGAGRTGRMTVAETLGEVPDMVVMAKGLSGGYFPLAALAVHDGIYHRLSGLDQPIGFINGSTTDGHPLGMAAGLAVLDILRSDEFLAEVRETGAFLRSLLEETLADLPAVRAVRGEGMMLCVDLADENDEPWHVLAVNDLRVICRDNGLLTSLGHGNLPLMPPLTISRAECCELAETLSRSIREYLRKR
ncbi:adenosylmethionine-8-amino-7-oxononanoate aminotransferase [Kibdelosporangium banguiense]|uniref:Adenosylmethionine-8-amino-7-oxononanoate aminotransferase n=1 Tax=Kibdelosporangium banguiense TaxID=1365924 RepID=A0ABS4TXH2_9PSEU|nr:aminotransferase class III-fold pyridoxal phosphate-dependent enzyme [Kibdelosporangium banguiense]MBP2328670.1 adenosylmethionine-8-amino-7-oxononanoate aminotransferase [Kibdelosporangium banguiense]